MIKLSIVKNIALCLMAGSIFFSCSEEESGKPLHHTVWEMSQSQWMGLSGQVSSITEATYEALGESTDEPFQSTIMRFDTEGRITYYDPTGVPATRMMGMEINRYRYTYEGQRLSSVEVEALGGETITYTLTYCDCDGRYVPLPFPVGSSPLYMVEGLLNVWGTNGLKGKWNGNEFVWSLTTDPGSRWEMTTTIACRYTAASIYPSEVEEQTLMGGEVMAKDLQSYTYNAEGFPISSHRLLSESDAVVEESETTYLTQPFMAIDHAEWKSGEVQYSLTYSYDSHHRVTSIRRSSTGTTETATESYLYMEEDDKGNWTRSNQVWNTLVNLNHPDAEVRVQRTITYY